MSKRGSGSIGKGKFAPGSANDPSMKPVDRDSLPQLQGTPKQIAWAKDIREKWIKQIEKTQEEYKNRIDSINEHKRTNKEKYQKEKEFRTRLVQNGRESIAAGRAVLNSTSDAKVIIGARNAFDDIVYDTMDAIRGKKSKDRIKKIIYDYQ